MTDPVISPDGKWMWTGSEWIPSPPTSAPTADSTINLEDSMMSGNVNVEQNSNDVSSTINLKDSAMSGDINITQNNAEDIATAMVKALERVGFLGQSSPAELTPSQEKEVEQAPKETDKKPSEPSEQKEVITDNVLEHKDYLAAEIELALSNAKITSKNVALSIPVTSAIIRVVTSPLMSDDELQKAIETDSLWENLVQLADNLNDYSIFHQVINRNSKNNTMEILFVASKLADVNGYSSIAKKAGLNPVIMDVRCFTLKNAYDNTKFQSILFLMYGIIKILIITSRTNIIGTI